MDRIRLLNKDGTTKVENDISEEKADELSSSESQIVAHGGALFAYFDTESPSDGVSIYVYKEAEPIKYGPQGTLE